MRKYAMTFDIQRFAQRLNNLKPELDAKPSLRYFLDADLEHNLSALRLMGVLPKGNSVEVAKIESQPMPRINQHGGRREGAGRRKLYQNHAEKMREYRKRRRNVSAYTFSSS